MSMLRFPLCAVLFLGGSLHAQTLASRIAQAPNGEVRLEIPSRSGVCGNGRDVIGYRNAIYAGNMSSFGRWKSDDCVPGPLRVTLTIANGNVTRVHTQVGGSWPAARGRVTDLGAVPPDEASAYFFALVPRLESSSGRDRILLPAVLARDAQVRQPLLAIARNEQRTEGTRRDAIHWLGSLGDVSVVPALVPLARDAALPEDRKGRKKSVGSAAMAALGMLDNDAGIPALIELTTDANAGVRREAVFWLGQSESSAARNAVRSVIENPRETGKVRAHAIFSLSHGGEVSDADFAYLRSLYNTLDDPELKDAIIQGMQEDEGDGGSWLIARALDSSESLKLRKSALFWAGQRDATPTTELVRAYRAFTDDELREHAIFVLSQRDDRPAVDALLEIARSDPDKEMRGKALFWLAQMDDPRVKTLIADLILK